MSDSVLFHIQNQGGWVTLNRPQSLNSLNLEMVQTVTTALQNWAADPTVQYVIIQGAGRAFCAGADLRMIYEAKQNQHSNLATEFFTQEYQLNLCIHNYPKPYIALLHGITMGGGMGLSSHGTYRVITENLLMAMPETAIGFFPDVGAAWYLNRCPGKTGLYLALTSTRIGPLDALYLGLATHYVPSANLKDLIDEIRNDKGADLNNVLKKHPAPTGDHSPVKDNQNLIDVFFGNASIEKIFEALSKSDSPFAVETLSQLKMRSPLSLQKTFEHFQSLEKKSIEEVMAADIKMVCSFEGSPEFIEGIRAAVIDKDQKPNWPSQAIKY